MHTLTTADLANVRSKSRVFARLLGLDAEPLQFKYSSSETDAYHALDCANHLLKGTRRFIGRTKHVGKAFDFVEDIKADMVEMLLLDDDAAKTAVKRKRHLPLFYLIVEPALETLRRFSHSEAVEHADALFDNIKDVMFHEDDYGTYDDAVVAQAQVKQVIRAHEEQAKIAATTRKRKSKKVVQEIETEIGTDSDLVVE